MKIFFVQTNDVQLIIYVEGVLLSILPFFFLSNINHWFTSHSCVGFGFFLALIYSICKQIVKKVFHSYDNDNKYVFWCIKEMLHANCLPCVKENFAKCLLCVIKKYQKTNTWNFSFFLKIITEKGYKLTWNVWKYSEKTAHYPCKYLSVAQCLKFFDYTVGKVCYERYRLKQLCITKYEIAGN